MLVAEVKDKLVELLEDSKPIDIEVGFGKGQFVIQKADKYRDVNFLGFEVRRKFVEYAKTMIEDLKLTNIYVECASADVAISEKIPENRVRNIYVNFPDPWWKRKHKKRRILKTEFINIFHKVMQIGGIIYVRTDVKEYADFVAENFSKLETFQPTEHDIIADNIMSNREVRCSEEGLDIQYLAFKKIK